MSSDHLNGGIAAPVSSAALDALQPDFYMARCHGCDAKIPFGNRADRDDWVQVHRQSHRMAIDTWRERPAAAVESGIYQLLDLLRRNLNITVEYFSTLAVLAQPDRFWLFWAWRQGVDHRWLTPRPT